MPRLNLRKSPDLSKPSEPSLARKNDASENTPNSTQLGIARELGSVAGITIEGRAKVDLESLLPAQGISINRDESKNTLSIGAGVGSTRGKLGVNIGAEIGFNPDGSTTLKSASGGVNVAGFGIEGKIGQGGGGLAVTILGVTVDVAKDEKGGISGGISIRLPGGEIGIGFQPGVEQKEIIVEPTPIIPPGEEDNVPPPPPTGSPPQVNTMTPDELIPYKERDETFGGETFEDNTNLLQGNGIAYVLVCGQAVSSSVSHGVYDVLSGYFDNGHTTSTSTRCYAEGGGLTNNRLPNGNVDISTVYFKTDVIVKVVTIGTKPEYPVIYDRYNNGSRASVVYNYTPYRSFSLVGCNVWSSNGNFAYQEVASSSASPTDFQGSGGEGTQGFLFRGPQNAIADWIRQENPKPHNNVSNISGTRRNRYRVCKVVPLEPQVKLSPQLPNHPQQTNKPMDCCDKVEEIYKYLGIAKLKKNKFPVSNAFLVPGGKGNDNCIDYYAITQALFRMLANGLILNPKSQPLGSEWQNVNATAWAGQIYEMMAESMSDGNSTQRFEVAAIMQLVQIMGAIAETGRKVEFVADAIGIEPEAVPEEVPVCFTVHENHKGFGGSKPKKLKTSNLKTDAQVEEVLGKMLNPSKIPIVRWQFKPGQISINEALRNNG
ncbi:hypothetical protein [Microcoleus sp. D2_18a_B4]|uniref:hypothetical protein n=1 Tax=Microcoleus sp. D2_18a_B4 TaxID=3055329 RepID=UPI002FD271A8